MRRNQPRAISAFAAGLLALLLAATFIAYVFGARPPAKHFEVHAVFRDAHDIKTGSPVRIAGIDVGKVRSVEAVSGGSTTARVTIRVDDAGQPIHLDAHLSIRPRIFLEGNFFIDLNPGSPSAPKVRDGDTIPVAQTSSLVTFSQVTSTLELDTRRSLRRLLAEVDTALRGPGARGFRRSIPSWEPAYRDSAVVADAFRGSGRDLSAFLRDGGAVAAALDRDPAALRAAIRDLRTTAGAFSRESRALDVALEEAPALVRSAQPALNAMNLALPPTRNLARTALPGVRALTPSLRAARPFVGQLAGLLSEPELGGLLSDLEPAVPRLARVLRDTPALLHQVRAASSCQNEVVMPTLKDEVEDAQFPASGPVYQEFAKALPGLAGESRSQDANGQWIRALFTGGNYAYPAPNGQTLLTSRPLAGANPGVPARGIPPFRPDVACETQQQPDLRSTPAPAPAGFRVNTTSPAATALARRGQEVARRFLKRDLNRRGLAGDLRLRETPLQRSEIDATLGNLP